jgi:hypothetical protein
MPRTDGWSHSIEKVILELLAAPVRHRESLRYPPAFGPQTRGDDRDGGGVSNNTDTSAPHLQVTPYPYRLIIVVEVGRKRRDAHFAI